MLGEDKKKVISILNKSGIFFDSEKNLWLKQNDWIQKTDIENMPRKNQQEEIDHCEIVLLKKRVAILENNLE
jgi:hypothetical protein